MPIYEYTCQKCHAHVEVMQKISDEPLSRHRECGGKLEKEWSQTSFQLKGAGWYVTDYATKKPDAKEKTDAAEKTETKETKTDATVKADSTAKDEGTKKKPPAPKPASTSSGGKKTD